MEKFNFNDWSNELEQVWDLRAESNYDTFSELMYALKGDEGVECLEKLIDAIKVREDYGAYEGLWNAIWAFPDKMVAQTLAKRLPGLQRRMGRYDQVQRFYLPIPGDDGLLGFFIDEAKNWDAADKRTALSAIKKWSVEDEEWEPVLEKLGKPVSKTTEDPIPEEWSDAWKERLQKARNEGGEFCISNLVWRGSKKEWIADFDFVIELLAMNHGKHWRQIDTITTPLWGFAKTTLYQEFVSRMKLLPDEKRNKILANIKKANKRKYTMLLADLENAGM